MKLMKKYIAILLSAVMIMCGLTACGGSASGGDTAGGSGSDKLTVVTTVFPQYDWTRAVLGELADDINLVLLIDDGTDIHSFQPSAADIMTISTCDVFICNGGESEEWVEDALKDAVNKDMKVMRLMDIQDAEVLEEVILEGMQEESHEGHDHDASDGSDDNELQDDLVSGIEGTADEEDDEAEVEYDEHNWLSLRNAQIYVNAIAAQLAEIDTENAEVYTANAAAYCEKLAVLDSEYAAAADGASKEAVMFGDRYPFSYMMNDYNIEVFAAFAGCSSETEASFSTIKFLAEKADELGLECILTIDGSASKIADTIVQNTSEKNQQILSMDSMQNIKPDRIEAGETYITIMESNLETLKAALA